MRYAKSPVPVGHTISAGFLEHCFLLKGCTLRKDKPLTVGSGKRLIYFVTIVDAYSGFPHVEFSFELPRPNLRSFFAGRMGRPEE
jgi:hypothetical protein